MPCEQITGKESDVDHLEGIMSEEKVQGCVGSAAGPVGQRLVTGVEQVSEAREEMKMHAMVGKEAPDFEASAFHEGGFSNIKLSDYRGKWVFLCFYPGDFTFV